MMVFNIQRFSTHDGGGIRTVVFFKGCPLQCLWCSNPEGQSFGYSIMYDKRICRGFEDCLKAFPGAITRTGQGGVQVDRGLIKDPLQLRDLCASGALTVSGVHMGVDDVIAEIEKDIPFYREGGGVTLSGGEPLSQGDDLVTLLMELNRININVNVETSLHVEWEKVERCTGLVDTFLADLKHTDVEKFRAFTGGDATLVMDNLNRLTGSGAQVIIRIPVIPRFNHTQGEMQQLMDYISSLETVHEVHFLPYHAFGIEKYAMLGMDYGFDHERTVREDELHPYLEIARSMGFNARIGG